MGLFLNLLGMAASAAIDGISDSQYVKTHNPITYTEGMHEGEYERNSFQLLDKWDSIFQGANRLIDPDKSVVTVPFKHLAHDALGHSMACDQYDINVTRYTTASSILEIGREERDISYVSLPMNLACVSWRYRDREDVSKAISAWSYHSTNAQSKVITSKYTRYHLRYSRPDEKGDGLVFDFFMNTDGYRTADFKLQDVSRDFGKDGLVILLNSKDHSARPPYHCETVGVLQMGLNDVVKGGADIGFAFCERPWDIGKYLGLEALLASVGRHEVFDHLQAFFESPVEYTEEWKRKEQERIEREEQAKEAARLKAEEDKKQEAERIRQEQEREEQMKLQKKQEENKKIQAALDDF